MSLQLKILNLESELVRLKNENSRERMKYAGEFTKKLNRLISKTPTGELRNELTELNILFNAACETVI